MAETMGSWRRSHYCGEVTAREIGSEVIVCGFVQKRRDLGNLIFLDLRDRTGLVQLAFDSSITPAESMEKAGRCRAEFVLMAKGSVRERQAKNAALKNGDIEVFVSELKILSEAEVPPFEITDKTTVKDELRLKYRYLDLRRREMQDTMIMRHKIVKAARDYFDENGFLEIETPILMKSTPEGARDYLVPSRVHPGAFYALPQSPQQYKQLLMLSGFDRYMQVARCFRDEDLRADRQPEVTQIDLEMSFADVDDVIAVNEGFMKTLFHRVLGIELTTPFRRIPYEEAMRRFGSDKPDTRFGLELTDLTDIVKDCGFAVFSGAAATGSVRAINVKGAAQHLSRKEIDKLADFVKTYGAKGLAFSRWTADAQSSSFEKFLSEAERQAIHSRMDYQAGDVLLVVADGKADVVFTALGALRVELADRLGLIPENSFDLLWVTDFPQFEYSEEEGRYVAMHHPFTAPKEEDIPLLKTDKAAVHAKAYDLVINGCEAGGGSVRINDPELQTAMFEALGFTREQAVAQFGYLIEAFSYGAPPHAGMAYGLDRLVMLLLHKDSIRDVIAFPKVQNASELMTACPSPVSEKQLDELGIMLKQ